MNCPIYINSLRQRQINAQIIQRNNRIRQRGPTIEQIEASREHDRERRQYFAIKNYYKNKPRKK